MRAVSASVALLLVCSAVVGAIPIHDSAARLNGQNKTSISANVHSSNVLAVNGTPVTNTPNISNVTERDRILSLPDGNVKNVAIDVVTIDAGIAIGFAANATAERMKTIALRQHILTANTSAERQRRILDAINEVEKQIITLRVNQQKAIEQFAAGEIQAQTLFVRLARIQRQADALEHRLMVLSRLAEENGESPLANSRIPSLVYQLHSFDGPIRERIARAVRGDAPPTRIYVAATEKSVVLTTIIDGVYVREVYRGDLRQFDGSSITSKVAVNVTARSFPDIWAAKDGIVSSGSGGTYIVKVPYPGGNLTAFIDGGIERVFKTYRRMPLENVSTGEVRVRTIDLTLRVNRTYAGGPLRVEVVDPETGEPVNAKVKLTIDGEGSVVVGMTGEDGVLWTVSPAGTFIVTAIVDDSDRLSTIEMTTIEPLTVADAYSTNGTSKGS